MSHAHEVNAFGALAFEVADRVQRAGNPHGVSVSAALAALHGLAGGRSIDVLAKVVGLSHSGAVRLVDRLAKEGLAERRAGGDGREVAVQLTPAGRRAARRVLARRGAAIEQVLAPLSSTERATLTSLHERLLGALTLSQQERARVCRMCDTDACGRGCPANANRLSDG